MSSHAPHAELRWVLVVERDGRARRVDVPDREVVLGSDVTPSVDIALDHPTVSRRHATLRPTRDGVEVVDSGSSNGTVVDGQRLVAGVARVVGPGERIFFGSLAGRFEAIEPAETIAAVDLAPASTSTRESTASAAPETLSMGSLRDFLAYALPELIDRLERRVDRADALDVVQAAGRAIFRSFPCREVEICEWRVGGDTEDAEDTDGVLFNARHEDSGVGDDEPITITAGPLRARLRFTPELHRRGVVPWIQLALRLAALGWPVPTTPESEPRPEPPRLPRPEPIDPATRELYEQAARIALGDVGVLIEGETGTGKEVLARYIHDASTRAAVGWVALNCAALPRDLLEAELFGIEKGVATGVEARAGKFELADGGTLFLDEIGDMAPATQAKILRVLEERQVYRIGAHAPRPARVRVVAATNRDLAELVENGDFRLDLYHRIADCRLRVPPLRQRRADLPSLAAHFLARAAAAAGREVRGISRAALDALAAHDWPGNVRQLEREMTRAVLFLEDGELLQTRHLHRELVDDAAAVAPKPGESLKAQLDAVERRILVDALERHDGNVRAAARALGTSRTTFYRRLGELSIEI